MSKIPIVFAFDETYRLPASIAIKSLFDSKKPDTDYEVFVMHDGLSERTMRVFKALYPINFVKIDKRLFHKYPTSARWPLSVYYRLLIANIFPMFDKIIYSDVDVLFKTDLSEIFNMDLKDFYWGGGKSRAQLT